MYIAFYFVLKVSELLSIAHVLTYECAKQFVGPGLRAFSLARPCKLCDKLFQGFG